MKEGVDQGCPSEEELVRLISGSADARSGEAEGVASLLAHLDSCEDCRQLAVTLARRSATEPGKGSGDVPLPAVEAGALVGRYVILHRIGAGGMGVVFAAYDPTLDRKVAIKFVRSRGPADGRAAEAERIAREARSLARLSHPNVVAVYDGGSHGELAYLVMEYVDGRTLRGWLADQKPKLSEIIRVLRKAGAGLRAIHDAGLIHRDFKPENVMVGKDGRVRVTDFGLALEMETPLEGLPELAGTVMYMAPEQLRRERADARSDQYAFGVTAHEALYGVHPFASARSRSQLFDAIREGTMSKGKAPGRIPRSIARSVQRTLAFDPALRYPTMRAMLVASMRDVLFASLHPFPVGWAILAAAVLVSGVVAAGVLGQRRAARFGMCRGAELKLAGVWDAAERHAVSTAFDGVAEAPFAHDIGQSVLLALDAYGSQWAGAYTEACEATRFRGERSEAMLDREMACLDTRRQEVKSLVSVLKNPSVKVARRAVEAVDNLTDVRGCLDTQALERRDLALHDPRAKAADGELARLKGRVDADDFANVTPDLDAALTSATEIGDRFAAARAHAMLAEAKRSTGDLSGAERSLLEAVFASEAAGDDEEEAVVWTRLAAIAGLEQAHAAESERYARHAESLIARLGSPLLHAKLSMARGKEALRAGSFDAAAHHFRDAIDLFAANGKGESRDAATCHDGLGYALGSSGKADEGREELLHSIATRERLFGPSHPDTASGLFDLSKLDIDEGRYADAEARIEKALAVFRALAKDDTPEIANITNSLGMVAWKRGRVEEGRARYVEALAMYRRLLGDHPATAVTAGNVAEVDLGAARFAESASEYREALGILKRAGSVDQDAEASLESGLGRAELGLGHLAEAKTELTRALAIYHSGSFDPVEQADAELGMAHVLQKQGERKRARELAEAARSAYESRAAAHTKELSEAEELLLSMR